MSMLYPLWTADNNTVMSSMFHVPFGHTCILTADGLKRDAFRQSAADIKSVQMACLRRVLFDFDKDAAYAHQSAKRRASLQVDWIFDITSAQATEMSNLQIITCCDAWSLSHESNIKALGLPGTYCLVFNDATAIGTAQVYAELIANEYIKDGALDGIFFP